MFSYSLSFALWTTYNERILEATESSDRLVTHYDSYLADGSRELDRLADFARIAARGDEDADRAQVDPVPASACPLHRRRSP